MRGVDSRTKKHVLIFPNTVSAITASFSWAVGDKVDQCLRVRDSCRGKRGALPRALPFTALGASLQCSNTI